MDNRRKKVIKSSVRDSIKKLISRAREAYREGEADRSKRYVRMALDLIKKHKTRLPEELRNSFCKKCCLVWIPARTVTVTYDKENDCLRLHCRCGHEKRL